MLGLLTKKTPLKQVIRGEDDKVVANKPLPSDVQPARFESLFEYEEVCSKLDYNPIALQDFKFKHFLFDREIPLYDYAHVIKYLGSYVKSDVHISWVPLKKSYAYIQYRPPYGDRLKVVDNISVEYDKLVPLRVLKTAALISETYPESKFYVSDLIKFPDPFAAVNIGTGRLHVFACWDEPGFSG
jgi:hypothetical protein